MSRILTGRSPWALLSLIAATSATAQSKPTIDQFMSPGFPSDLISARRADRIAWLADERGRRNVFTAAAPDWKPVRITNFMDDDGVVLSDISISNDGAITITNSTLSGNNADTAGGGILNEGSMQLVSVTITGNRATGNAYYGDGGGIHADAPVSFRNTLIADNYAPSGWDCAGALQSAGYNFIPPIRLLYTATLST